MTIGDRVIVGNATGRITEIRFEGALVEFETGRYVEGRTLWCTDAQIKENGYGESDASARGELD